MKNVVSLVMVCLIFLTSCARDLSTDLYTSDSTMSLTLEGTVLAKRQVRINNTDKLSDNTVGIMTGAIGGGALGASGDGSTAMIVGGALVAGLVGGAIQHKMSQTTGYEYIVKIDTSKLGDSYYEGSAIMRNAISSARTSGLITIVQNTKNPLSEGQKVYIIVSDKRARIIPQN